MSSQSYRRPEFRLNLGYPEVSLARTGALAPIGVIAPDSPHFIGELRRFGGVVTRAHGRLVVVLPEDEVWRGRAVLPGGTRRARHRAALEAGADGLAMPHEAISLVLGTPGPDGTTPLAAVRRGTLAETQALLRHVGIRHAGIVGAGAFPGFAAAPRLDVSPLRLPEIDLPNFALLSRLPQLHLPRLTWPKQLPTLIWPPRDRRLLLSAGGAASPDVGSSRPSWRSPRQNAQRRTPAPRGSRRGGRRDRPRATGRRIRRLPDRPASAARAPSLRAPDGAAENSRGRGPAAADRDPGHPQRAAGLTSPRRSARASAHRAHHRARSHT